MSNYCYEAIDSGGAKTQGMLDVADQSEALRRIKEMGLFPTRIAEKRRRRAQAPFRPRSIPAGSVFAISIPFPRRRVKPSVLAVFTRQLATLVEAGMPLLRGLRILQEQEESPVLKRIIGEIAVSVEGGNSLSEALAAYPKIFNPLYTNMTRAGEVAGALELTLRRLADFMEKAQKIRSKVKAAMFYPAAVMIVATLIMIVLMTFVVPRFKEVFQGLLEGRAMPAFTQLILDISEFVKNHTVIVAGAGAVLGVMFMAALRTRVGRRSWDFFKLSVPILGPIIRKSAISRFTRTLGTLLNSGVPVLQALTIVKETAGNVVVGSVIANIHDSVKQGETIAVPLKASGVFPAMVAGMVDVGEQTGALPDMLLKVADNYDGEVDDAVSAMTSLLEPIMIVFLAIVVGSIVIAMFLPLVYVIDGGINMDAGGRE